MRLDKLLLEIENQKEQSQEPQPESLSRNILTAKQQKAKPKTKPSKFIATQKYERIGSNKTVDIEVTKTGLRIKKTGKYSMSAYSDWYPKEDAIKLAKTIARVWGTSNVT